MCAKSFLQIRFAFSFVERINIHVNSVQFAISHQKCYVAVKNAEKSYDSLPCNKYGLVCSDDGNVLEEAIKRRGLQRSVMQYSTFDWSSIPLSQERRLAPDSIPDQPRILTVRFRQTGLFALPGPYLSATQCNYCRPCFQKISLRKKFYAL